MTTSLPEMTAEHKKAVTELFKSLEVHRCCYNVDRDNYRVLLSEVFYSLCSSRNILSVPKERRMFYIARMVTNLTRGNKKTFYYRHFLRNSPSFWVAHEFGRTYHEEADEQQMIEEREREHEMKITSILEHNPIVITHYKKTYNKSRIIWETYLTTQNMLKVSKDLKVSRRIVSRVVNENVKAIRKRYERISN